VSIRIRTAAHRMQFVVSDTGIGIPENKLTAVFDRFEQVGNDRSGLGLGLHISKCIVEAHGGRIWAESGGIGSTFFVELPVIPVTDEEGV
jgi:signal transduction histidine kinase